MQPATTPYSTTPRTGKWQGHKVDGVKPRLRSAAVDGAALTLSYGEALDGSSTPAAGDFTVRVDGAERSLSGVSVSGSAVTLMLTSAVAQGEAVTVSYRPGPRPIQDAAGNDADGLSNESVTNTTGAPNTAPEITSPGPFDVPENQARVSRLTADRCRRGGRGHACAGRRSRSGLVHDRCGYRRAELPDRPELRGAHGWPQ